MSFNPIVTARAISGGALTLAVFSILVAVWPAGGLQIGGGPELFSASASPTENLSPTRIADPLPPPPPYIPPQKIKAIYVTASTALSPKRMEGLFDLVERTELNAMVVNVNDDRPDALHLPEFQAIVARLNDAGVHTIARVVVFQNEGLVRRRPELALHTTGGAIWSDRGGHHWIDPANHEAWDEIVATAKKAMAVGFREINYDYIRFPSDLAGRNAVFPAYDGVTPKNEIINAFAKYSHDALKKENPDVLLSIDIFGHPILVENDAGIGQRFIEIVDYFDAVAPMVYPSHYRAGNFGFADPAANPYGIVFGTLEEAKRKLDAEGKTTVIRPWLQDFDLGANYTADMVRAQMTATEDAGYDFGWMLWNAGNSYTAGALLEE